MDNDTVLLDVIDPERKKKLDDGAEAGDIWHDDDDDDDDDDGAVEIEKGVTHSHSYFYTAVRLSLQRCFRLRCFSLLNIIAYHCVHLTCFIRRE